MIVVSCPYGKKIDWNEDFWGSKLIKQTLDLIQIYISIYINAILLLRYS